jgi:quinol-cytochrome oxidoreductase complex cytochrome b subunit
MNKDKYGIQKNGIPFHPYYSVKDIVGVVEFLMILSAGSSSFFFPWTSSILTVGESSSCCLSVI